MAKGDIVVRFEEVNFGYKHAKPLLEEVSFSVRRGTKATIMGQNGAGKSTIFSLITGATNPPVGETRPESGRVIVGNDVSIAISRQVIPRADLELSVREFFLKCFAHKVYDIDPKIEEVLEVVNLHAPLERHIKTFSGGQQARLLLASALIQDPDLLLLDEPTNNLDKSGIEHLTKFLVDYKKTCLVISHDADFLNAFTDGVLYLDIFTRKVESYVGNYFDVVEQIKIRVEKENRKNAQLAKEIQEKKDKANFFAHKGGKMRLVAKRMRETAEELEEEKVDIRREDKTIHTFTIPSQPDLVGEILKIPKHKISLKRNRHLLLAGPNGIGKSTMLEAIVKGVNKVAEIAPGVRVGYYRQDFSNLNFDDTVHKTLFSAMQTAPTAFGVGAPTASVGGEEMLRKVAAGFLITSELINATIGSLSEGQKGLVAFARLVLERPGLLLLDEPTNHINFRHLPIIALALNKYDGAMILVSHVPEFVSQIRIDEILDLGKKK